MLQKHSKVLPIMHLQQTAVTRNQYGRQSTLQSLGAISFATVLCSVAMSAPRNNVEAAF